MPLKDHISVADRYRVDTARRFVPKGRYTDRAFLELEWDRMWTRVWTIAGPLSDLQKSGDWIQTEIGGESILVSRDVSGRLLAWHNVCPHRGNRLRHGRCGHAEIIRCSYHHWEWDLEGRLLRIADPESFPHLAGASDSLALRPVRCESWGGWAWINLDPDAEPLADYLGGIAAEMEPYLLHEHALIRDVTVEWDANWKLCIDNSDETYHVQGIHPGLLDLIDDYNTPPRLWGRHSDFVVRFGAPSHRSPRTGEIPEGLRGIMRKVGLDPVKFPGRVEDVRAALQRTTRERFRANGIDFPAVGDEALIDNYHAYIFPNTLINIVLPGFWLFRPRPHPTDPGKMYFDFQEYERLPPGAPRPRPKHERYQGSQASLDNVLDQDAYIVPFVQLGMQSRAFEGLLLGTQEERLLHMHRTLDEYVFGEGGER